MPPLLLAGIVAGLALALTAALTPVVRAAALGGGMVRAVQEDRWHTRPTPAVGGIAIFVGFGLALAAGYLLDPDATRGMSDVAPQAVLPLSPWEGLLLGAGLAFVVGLVDDFVHLRPLAKLAGQVMAASVLLLSGIGVWLTGWYALDAALSLLWFVGLTNALNLLDNMDGLAAGVAGIAGAYLALLFALEGSTGLSVLALTFSAALGGFLVHNYPPARIFMGDSGSLFLGLFLAGLALAPAPGLSRSLAAVVAAPALILGVPILDTTLVTVGRVLEGRPVSQGGRDHTSHRFVTLGITEKRTVWLLWALAAAGGSVGILLRSANRGTALLLGGALVGGLCLLAAYLLAARLRDLEGRGAERLSLYRFVVGGQQRYPVAALFLDGLWITLAYYAAYVVRWDARQLPLEFAYFQRTVLVWVVVKLVALVITGTYAARWRHFGLHDAIRLVRSNMVASLVAAGLLMVLDRVGLSRGVVAIDFLVCTALTVGARFSFRLIEGGAVRWSDHGTPVVVLAAEEEVEMAARHLRRLSSPDLHPVAAADPGVGAARARLGSLPLYGGEGCLERALAESGARAVVIVGEGWEGAGEREVLDRPRADGDELHVYRLDVVLRREG